MAKKLPTIPHRRLPQYGVIEGGALDGWRFALTEIRVRGRNVFIEVNATPPAWCFPTPVLLNARTDFKTLRAGEKAPLHDSAKLIERAVDAEKYQWSDHG
jgi:hypothetical protein